MNRSTSLKEVKAQKSHSIAVILHLFYTELFDEIRATLDNLGGNFDLYVSLPETKAEYIETIKGFYPDAHVLIVENRGRDLAPFLEFLKVVLPLDYDYLLKIHTKETIHRLDGDEWRRDVFCKLLGSKDHLQTISTVFSNNPSLVMIGPKDHVLNARYYMGSNREKLQSLLYKAGYPQALPESFSFVASTMFWAKPGIFAPLLKMGIEPENFESEPLPSDGCLPHALERFLGLLAELQGGEIRAIKQDGSIVEPDPNKIFPFAAPPTLLKLRELKSVVFYSAYAEAYAIEHLRIRAPFAAAGVEIIEGVRNGIADPDLAGDGDAVIFQREFPRNVKLYDQIISNARAAGKYVFYELDDWLFNLPENHPEKIQELYNSALLPMLTAVAEADLVLVATDELRRVVEVFNPNVLVLPNYLDDALWHLRTPGTDSDNQLVKIGYMGSDSHTPDLALIAPVIKKILTDKAGKVRLDVWGTPLPDELTDFEGVNWHPSPTNIYTDFVKYFQTLDFDIGIAPLADNPFNRCKSGLKFLEYSANGIAGVYSRITPYATIVDHGTNGFLAGDSQKWYQYLTRLIDEPELRVQIVRQAQEDIHRNWLLSQNIRTWKDIFCRISNQTYVEDPNKSVRSNTINNINRQLYLSRENQESYALKREREFNTRLNELEVTQQEVVEGLNAELAGYKHELNEIHQNRLWKKLSAYQAYVHKQQFLIRKGLRRVARIKRIIFGVSGKRRQVMIDSGLFDAEYYLRVNPDVKNSGADPLAHFLNYGGNEGRDPSPDFDSSWYLETYPDVKANGINPLLHYLLYGKGEGRAAQPVTLTQNTLSSSGQKLQSYGNPTKAIPDNILLAPKIQEILESKLREEYVISLSHDNYLSITGGAQIYLADEQRLINQQNKSYIHVYPYKKENTLVSSEKILYVGVNVDGEPAFETEPNELVTALTALENKKLMKLVIHHTMGFNLVTLQLFLDFAQRKGTFWLHDYFSLCPSYNLRRNDNEYCGAPDIQSNACQLCKYGHQRRLQAPEIEQLFRENQLDVAAPSRFSYELWQSRFPIQSTPHIIPPAALKWKNNTPADLTKGILRIGFLGYPLDYKGWQAWLRLTQELNGNKRYEFFHFSTQSGALGNYTRIDARVTKENRLAMVESLRQSHIDVAFLWSIVPETFSFTLHEALAAGCYIVTNPNSGNIQDYIKRHPKRGSILQNETELFKFLRSDDLVNSINEYQKYGKPQAELVFGSLEEIE